MSAILSYTINLGSVSYPTTYNALVAFLDPYIDEITAARDSQASLLASINTRIKASEGLTQTLQANNNRITELPTPVAADEPATKSYADGLAFSSALPAISQDTFGLGITNNGSTAFWGVPAAAAAGAAAAWFGF